MMKNLLTALLLFAFLGLYSQVGINTVKPKAGLDVNGDYNLRGKLSVLSLINNKLFEGTHNQVLVSQGEGFPPAWKSLRIPEYEPNKFYLIYNNSFSDRIGVKFTSAEESGIMSRAATFVQNNDFSNFLGFKKITGLSQPFTVNSTQSKVYFQFETIIQADTPNNTNPDISMDYACGIFVDDKLIGLRQGNLKASSSTLNLFVTHDQISMMQNLSVGSHTVSVGCSRLSSYNASGLTLAFGINAAPTNLNDFMAQSSLKVDVYEVPQVFNPITN